MSWFNVGVPSMLMIRLSGALRVEAAGTEGLRHDLRMRWTALLFAWPATA